MIDTNIYTLFSDSKVFDNETLNVFLNQLYTLLINNLDPTMVNTQLMIDGGVSLLLQGEEVSDIQKISMTTSSADIFNFLKKTIFCLNVQEVSFSEKMITVKSDKTVVSIQLDETATDIIDYNGIALRNKDNVITK